MLFDALHISHEDLDGLTNGRTPIRQRLDLVSHLTRCASCAADAAAFAAARGVSLEVLFGLGRPAGTASAGARRGPGRASRPRAYSGGGQALVRVPAISEGLQRLAGGHLAASAVGHADYKLSLQPYAQTLIDAGLAWVGAELFLLQSSDAVLVKVSRQKGVGGPPLMVDLTGGDLSLTAVLTSAKPQMELPIEHGMTDLSEWELSLRVGP